MGAEAEILDARRVGGLVLNEAGMIDVGAMRPYMAEDGSAYYTAVNAAGQAEAVPINNALLRKDEWISLDEMVRRIATKRLNAIADLQSRGLIYNAGDLGTTVVEWERSSDMTDAELNMSGVSRTEEDSVDFSLQGVPLPIVRKDFRVNIRRLLASRRMGAAVDTFQAGIATRLVAERSERMLFNGANPSVGGYSVYGYTNHPDRVTFTLTAAWTDTTNRDILADVENALSQLDAARHHGPFVLYVPSDYYAQLRGDYKAESERTFLQRIEAYPEIEAVKPADELTGDNIVFVQLDSEVVDLAVAQDITTVQWASGDRMTEHFAVMAAWVPRIKSDYAARLGIAHGTP